MITMPDVVEEVEADQPKVVNVANRFKFSDVEMVKYLTGKKWTDFKRDKDKPLTKTLKVIFFADKNSGKSHNICTIAELDKRNPKLKLAEYAHVAFLLEEGQILPGNPLVVADLEGKFDNLRIKGKFKGYPIRYVDVWHPDGPMVNMQNPVEVIRDLRLFLSANKWAFENPVQFKQMTAAEGIEGGLDAPGAIAVENYTILTTEIMNYARVVAHPENIKELEARGQELGAPIIPKFDNWSIRDGNWDFIGGFTQRLPMHYAVTCRQRQKWKNGAPTDEEDLAQYKMAKYAFNVIVNLYKERNPETNSIEFWGQIIESDFMDAGIVLAPFKNPCFLKVVAEITKYSHAEILDKHGTWKESPEGGMIWVKNKVEKTAPATTPSASSLNTKGKGVTHTPALAASSTVAMLPAGSQVEERDGKVEAKPVEKPAPAAIKMEKPAVMPSTAAVLNVNTTVASKPAMKPAKPRAVKPSGHPGDSARVTETKSVIEGSKQDIVSVMETHLEKTLENNEGPKVLVPAPGGTIRIYSTDETKEMKPEEVIEEIDEAESDKK